LSRPSSSRSFSSSHSTFVRVNGRIRAREVRVIGPDGQQVGVLPLGEALTIARSHGIDLVEVAPNATPPVCRMVDYGKYRYEQAKKEKESKKHHHAHKVKEVQLSVNIDPHDFNVKLGQAIDFLCEEMKVKITLRFRGREMAHKELGFQVVERFIKEASPFGQPDFPTKLVGKGINVMVSPLPRAKRAKNPRQPDTEEQPGGATPGAPADNREHQKENKIPVNAAEQPSQFGQNPFAQLDSQVKTGH
jgi:translation initiation factor IF-3